jgi:hypothetical protein
MAVWEKGKVDELRATLAVACTVNLERRTSIENSKMKYVRFFGGEGSNCDEARMR